MTLSRRGDLYSEADRPSLRGKNPDPRGRNASSAYSRLCREEATRTPDPYVPNVVRYQLRYFSKFSEELFGSFFKSGCKDTAFF